MVLGWLRSSLSESLLGQMVACKTSAQLWSSLQSIFSASSRARKADLRCKLQNTTKSGLSCSDYFQTMRAIADELAFIGSPISDEDLMMHILGGLGPDFNSFVAASKSKDDLTIDQLQASLFSFESLLQSQVQSSSLPSATNPAAFYSNTGNFNSGQTRYAAPRLSSNKTQYRNPGPRNNIPILNTPRPNYNPNYRPNYTTNRPVPNRPPPRPSSQSIPEFCQICYKRGHTARACWYRSDLTNYPEEAPPQAHLTQQTPSTYGDYASPQAFVAQPASLSSSTEWYLDSGATHHVTSDLNNLSSFMPYEGFDKLHIGNRSGMQIHHIGSSSLKISNHHLSK